MFYFLHLREAPELSWFEGGGGWVSCLLLWNKGMVCLLSRVNQHCPSPERFVFSIQPAVCYQAITKKLKVCEEVKQIFTLMDVYCYEALQFFQSCALNCFYYYFSPLSSPPPCPCPPPHSLRRQDPPPSRQQTAQQSMAASHLQTKSKIFNTLQPFPSQLTHAAILQPVTEKE